MHQFSYSDQEFSNVATKPVNMVSQPGRTKTELYSHEKMVRDLERRGIVLSL